MYKLIGTFLLISLGVQAQFDQGRLYTPIPPSSTTPGGSGISIQPKQASIYDIPPKNDTPITFGKEEKSIFAPKEKFVNPHEDVKDKLNKRNAEGSGDYKIFRRHQYFGDFRTKADKIKVIYRDPQAVDGDYLRVYHNEKVVKDNINLQGTFSGFTYELEPGFNKFDFEALNEGKYFPNTGEFSIIIDGEVIYNSEWNLATGFKATFLIVKE